MAWMTSRDATNFRADVANLLPGTAVIQSVSYVSDGGGGQPETWTAAGTVACRLDPLPQTAEATEYTLQSELTVEPYQLTLPHDSGLTREHRVSIESRIYEIVRIEASHQHRVSTRAIVNYVGVDEA